MAETISVSAPSLYEAAALAIAEFRRCGLADAAAGPATRLKVAVEAPATTHDVSVGRLQAWLNASGKTPREQAAKATLRAMLST